MAACSCPSAQRSSAAFAPGLVLIVSGRAQRIQLLRSRLSVAHCAGCSPAPLVLVQLVPYMSIRFDAASRSCVGCRVCGASALHEKTSASAPACLPWRFSAFRLSVLPPGFAFLPTPVEQELHACLLAGAVAMHRAPAWEV